MRLVWTRSGPYRREADTGLRVVPDGYLLDLTGRYRSEARKEAQHNPGYRAASKVASTTEGCHENSRSV